ncbi:MAG TPA: complex I NDUFA9 subunit family protein [Rickettsiales bacterium]|nr:complex I NDUFA9 subunit family protein [Rickettsiales bacterium]
MERKIITVIGGTGFLGRYVIELLAAQGWQVRVIARDVDSALKLKTYGDVGQIALMSGDITKPASLQGKLDNSFAVVNLAGILYERGRQRFNAVHVEGVEKLVAMAAQAGVPHFVHVSSLSADGAGQSQYARTKAAGERAVRAVYPGASILRPSAIFGAEDNLFNRFAKAAKIAPCLPLIGGGKTRFQPVYVGDVAQAVSVCLAGIPGTFELGGPDIYTMRGIMEFASRTIGRKPCFINIPFSLAGLLGSVAQFLPCPPLTRDQVILLQHDSIVTQGVKTFADLGIAPQSVSNIVPGYLARLAKANFHIQA